MSISFCEVTILPIHENIRTVEIRTDRITDKIVATCDCRPYQVGMWTGKLSKLCMHWMDLPIIQRPWKKLDKAYFATYIW